MQLVQLANMIKTIFLVLFILCLLIFNAVLNKSLVETNPEDQILYMSLKPYPEPGGEPRV